MSQSSFSARGVTTARPKATAALMQRTGLDDEVLKKLVVHFYGEVRKDPLLGPVFEQRIQDWNCHLARMTAFWSSVALMTGRYHGSPMEAHKGLDIGPQHFERWLAIFRRTAHETCQPHGAMHLITRAETMAGAIRVKVLQQARENVS